MIFNKKLLHTIAGHKIIMILFLFAMIFACAENGGKKSESPKAADGAQLYKKYCVLCHGAEGNLGINGSKDIRVSLLTRGERIELIKNGKNAMTPFSGILSEEEIAAIADYTMTMKLPDEGR